MAMELCAVIGAILAAFSNGMDISKKMAAKKGRKSSKKVETSTEESQLYNSLHQRPHEIKVEYENSVSRHGHQFEVGDPQSHASLAHTLLMMNSGLIEIINHTLSDSSKAKAMSRKSLLKLSEVAAADTMNALAELNGRLNTSSQLKLDMRRSNLVKEVKQGRTRSKTDLPGPGERPAPSPLLARGGWVRSKSGPSVVGVVSASSARKHAARKDDHKRSQSTPASPLLLDTKPTVMPIELPAVKPVQPASKQYYGTEDKSHHALQSRWTEQDFMCDIKTELPPYSKQRPPSMLIVPSDFFETYHLDVQRAPPPRPPKIPLHLRPRPSSRARPISGATFMTASTKIGEIPEDRLPDRHLSAEQRQRIPLPYVIPPPLLEEPKKKRRGFRLWKKQTMAVY